MDNDENWGKILERAVDNFMQFKETSSQENLRIAETLVDKIDLIDKTFPDDDAPHYFKAEIYLHVNRLEDALRSINHAIELNPNKDLHYDSKSTIYDQMDKNISAIRNITIAIKLNPTIGRYYMQRGNILVKNSINYSKALEDFNSAEKLYSETPKINPRMKVKNAFSKSFVLISLKKYEEAIEIADTYTKITGDYTNDYIGGDREIFHAMLLNNKGFSLLALGKIDDALTCLNEGLKFHYGLENIHSLIGDAYRLKGETNKAKDSYARTLELFKRNDEENFKPAIRAERGFAKLGIIINNSIEQEAINKKIYNREELNNIIIF